MALGFIEATGDCCQAPVLVRFMELSGGDSGCLEARTKQFQVFLVACCQVNVRGMVVGRATVCVGVLHGGMAGLDSLLREWDVAARDAI